VAAVNPTLWQRLPATARDGLLAALLCVLDLSTQWSENSGTLLIGAEAPWPVVYVFAGAGYAALAWRRRRPGVVFLIILLHNIAAQLFLPWRPLFGLIVALYTVAAYTTLRWSLFALLSTVVPFALTAIDEASKTTAERRTEIAIIDIILYSALALTVWGVGRLANRSRRDLRAAEARRERAIAEERARIARELHDIVAHSVTVMVLQAAGARRILLEGPPQVAEALGNIESTGRQAMDELRRMLRLLTTANAPSSMATEPEPHPGLADLNSVVSRVVTAGLPVELNHRGTPLPLDASVGLAAHRVVSEALTNALKHAGTGARTVVLLDWSSEGVTVSITDDGRGDRTADSTALSARRGLIGLGERVHAVGGRFWAGPLPAGGYRVSATLPASGRLSFERTTDSRVAGHTV
jgi:signal transduction histidine kinase